MENIFLDLHSHDANGKSQKYLLPNGGDLMAMNPMVQKVNKHITLNKVFIWMFLPQNGWFIRENPIKMDDLGGKPTIFGNTHLHHSKLMVCTKVLRLWYKVRSSAL